MLASSDSDPEYYKMPDESNLKSLMQVWYEAVRLVYNGCCKVNMFTKLR